MSIKVSHNVVALSTVAAVSSEALENTKGNLKELVEDGLTKELNEFARENHMSDPYGITFSYEPFDPMNEDHKRLNISYGAGIHIVVARAHALTRRTR